MLQLDRVILQNNISDKFDVDIYVTFWNFQTSLMSHCPVKMLTPLKLSVSYCNFIWMFSTSKF